MTVVFVVALYGRGLFSVIITDFFSKQCEKITDNVFE